MWTCKGVWKVDIWGRLDIVHHERNNRTFRPKAISHIYDHGTTKHSEVISNGNVEREDLRQPGCLKWYGLELIQCIIVKKKKKCNLNRRNIIGF